MTRSVPCLLLASLPLFAAAPPGRPTPEQETELARREPLEQEFARAAEAGKPAEALKAGRAVLDIERRVLGPWHRDTEGTASSLGDFHQGRAEWPEEAEYRRAVLAARRRLDGEGHWRTDEAGRLLAEALAHTRRPPAHRAALARAQGLITQARALSAERKHAEALALLRQALALRQGVVGERHPEYALALSELATAHYSQNRPDAALPLNLRAMAAFKERLGERHPYTLSCLRNVATALKDRGEFRAALPLLRRVVAGLEEASGERHEDFLTALSQLGVLLTDLAEYDAAERALERASALYREVAGERHPEYANSLMNLGRLYQDRGQLPRALGRYRQALAVLEPEPGRRADFALCLNYAASVHQRMGDYPAALSAYRRVLAVRKEALGTDHPDYAGTLNDLALLHAETGD
ncbi:MAG: tetratricopeptide repeat protein, partial [Gemmataceae bacterium]